MMILRTRLAPGRGWVFSPRPPAGNIRVAANDFDWQDSRRRRPAPTPAPLPPPLRPGEGVPGLDVTELDSETIFDRLFDPKPPQPRPDRF